MPAIIALLLAALWHVQLAVHCAGRCVHRPALPRIARPAEPVPQPAPLPPSVMVDPPVLTPQCRGPACQTPPPVRRFLRR